MMDDLMGAVFGLGLILATIGAWMTHIAHCFTVEAWGFLIAGAMFFPVAVVHGVGLWFGLWG